MTITVLVHPVHGAKIATLEAEVEHDLKLGWTIQSDKEHPEQEKSEPSTPPRRKKTTGEAPVPTPSFLTVPKE